MAIRMTGMVSGLDTDAVVQELMAAQSAKKQKVVNKQTKLTWTQEIWKELNTKLYSLYTGSLSKMKTQGNYQTKKVSSSNESAVKATATSSAATGAHSLKIMELASAQYVTGGTVNRNGTNATTDTTLSTLGMEAGTSVTIKNGEKEKILTVGDDTTIKDFVNACKEVGLNANFDTKQQRFFISSAKSGAENAFSITTGTSKRTEANSAITSMLSAVSTDDELCSDFISAADAVKSKLKSYATVNGTDLDGAVSDFMASIRNESATDEEEKVVYEKYNITQAQYDNLKAAFKKANDADSSLNVPMTNYLRDVSTADEVKTSFDTAAKNSDSILFKSELTAAYNNLKDISAAAFDELKALDVKGATSYTEDELTAKGITKVQYDSYKLLANKVTDKTAFDSQMDMYIANEVGDKNLTADGKSQLSKLGLGEIDSTGKTITDSSGDVSVKWASDAKIELDGAVLTDSSNEFTVNGLTMNLTSTTLNKTTGEYEEVQLNVTNDTDAVYNMVKDFIKQYNEVLKELNTKYDAKSARDYDPLTDEQKEAMSEDEIEKWETKIKDSLLRKDNTINSITAGMRTAMLTTTKVDGKTYSLASIGIKTSSDYTEKGLLHIAGDADDDTYSAETNKLKEMLEQDPDVVMEVLSNAAKNLYSTFTDKMARTSLSSALTFYNDKQMTTQQTTYAKEIANWDKKLQDMEDRYYKQFTAMEMAMQKLQSQSNYFASMMGTGQ